MSIIKDNNIKVEKEEGGQLSITGTLSVESLDKYRAESLQFFSDNLKIDGFRQGNIPENVILKNISEVALYEEMAGRALNDLYPEIIREEKLDVFGRPHVHFTKLAPGNPIEFLIHTALAPSVEIADYKKIAKEINDKKQEVTVTDEEVEKALLEVRKELDRREETEKENTSTETDATEVIDEKVENSENTEKEAEEKEPSLLTDEKVQTISPAKTVEEFTKIVRDDLLAHKKNQANEKHRLEIVEKILAESKISVPAIVVDSELQSMMAQFAHDVTQAGIGMEDYLAQSGKTEEELIKEWQPHAENRAKMQLLLNKIAVEEDLFPEKEIIDAQVDEILAQTPKAERERVEVYVETQLANANVFDFLEKQQ